MYPMIQNRLRAPVTRLITPVCEYLLRRGLTANMLTAIGAIGVVIVSFTLFASGELFLGTLWITFFALSDLLDGTMARISKSNGSKWGAFLDSTLDRISDAAICIGLWLYFRDESLISSLLLLNLFLGGLIPYIRARAEGLSIKCDVGIAERVERLIIILYYYEELTMKEIGATLDLSESRVSQMHSSIVSRLQEQLGRRRPEFGT